ncbi:MAG: Holliday junction branch migration protein RuvA [Desulfovibrio sp.]|nr:MAG: Holliday junction branch migration protein RuvA [Desulfovibrio sp.]
MIAYLTGTLLEVGESSCLLLTEGGTGYEVALPATFLSQLPDKGEQVEIYIATIVREDALDLYGFASWDERTTFQALISVPKLGPKTALAMLSMYTPDDLRTITASDDLTALKRVPGIGAKTAQTILLELKYKLKTVDSPALVTSLKDQAASVLRDALTGLTNLGYGEDEAAKALETVLGAEPDLDVTSALRAALKHMAGRR